MSSRDAQCNDVRQDGVVSDSSEKWNDPRWLRRTAFVESVVSGIALCFAVGFGLVGGVSSAIFMALVAICAGALSYVFAKRSRELS